MASHIPTANFIDINIATCPKPNEPFALYEPEIFEKYAQFLGINQDDHLVLYGGGLLGGMLWAGKVYWLFKVTLKFLHNSSNFRRMATITFLS